MSDPFISAACIRQGSGLLHRAGQRYSATVALAVPSPRRTSPQCPAMNVAAAARRRRQATMRGRSHCLKGSSLGHTCSWASGSWCSAPRPSRAFRRYVMHLRRLRASAGGRGVPHRLQACIWCKIWVSTRRTHSDSKRMFDLKRGLRSAYKLRAHVGSPFVGNCSVRCFAWAPT